MDCLQTLHVICTRRCNYKNICFLRSKNCGSQKSPLMYTRLKSILNRKEAMIRNRYNYLTPSVPDTKRKEGRTKNNDTTIKTLQAENAGLGDSIKCTVRLETRRSRVQSPPRSATFFRIHEIFSTVILSLPLKGSCQFLAKECAQYWLTA